MLTFCVQRSSSDDKAAGQSREVGRLPWQGIAGGVDGGSCVIPFACLKYCELIRLPVHLGKEIACSELSGELALGICLVPVRYH